MIGRQSHESRKFIDQINQKILKLKKGVMFPVERKLVIAITQTLNTWRGQTGYTDCCNLKGQFVSTLTQNPPWEQMISFCYSAEISGNYKSNMDCKVLYKRKKVCRQLCEFGVTNFLFFEDTTWSVPFVLWSKVSSWKNLCPQDNNVQC